MEDFSGLALPPLFGGHILEAELEPAGVELGPGEVTTQSYLLQWLAYISPLPTQLLGYFL